MRERSIETALYDRNAALFEVIRRPVSLCYDDQILTRALNHSRLDRNPQLRIEHHPQQRPAALETRAIGEQRIVSKHCSDTCKNRVRGVPQRLGVSARSLARDPSCFAAPCRNLAIEGQFCL